MPLIAKCGISHNGRLIQKGDEIAPPGNLPKGDLRVRMPRDVIDQLIEEGAIQEVAEKAPSSGTTGEPPKDPAK